MTRISAARIYSSVFLVVWYMAAWCRLPIDRNIPKNYTAWKVSVFGVFLVHIFPHSDWIQRDTPCLSLQSQCRKIRIRKTLNTNTFYAVLFFFIAYHHPEHYLVVLELGGLDHFSVSYLLPSYGVNFKIERQIMFHLLSKLKCIRV